MWRIIVSLFFNRLSFDSDYMDFHNLFCAPIDLIFFNGPDYDKEKKYDASYVQEEIKKIGKYLPKSQELQDYFYSEVAKSFRELSTVPRENLTNEVKKNYYLCDLKEDLNNLIDCYNIYSTMKEKIPEEYHGYICENLGIPTPSSNEQEFADMNIIYRLCKKTKVGISYEEAEEKDKKIVYDILQGLHLALMNGSLYNYFKECPIHMLETMINAIFAGTMVPFDKFDYDNVPDEANMYSRLAIIQKFLEVNQKWQQLNQGAELGQINYDEYFKLCTSYPNFGRKQIR